jgi:hypothetical protein
LKKLFYESYNFLVLDETHTEANLPLLYEESIPPKFPLLSEEVSTQSSSPL